MDYYLNSFVDHPMLFFGAFFSFFAAIAFVTFLAGFLGGERQLVTMSENEVHMQHARTRMVWGVGWLALLFGFWELLQVIVGNAPRSRLWLDVVVFAFVFYPDIAKIVGGLFSSKSPH